MMQTATAALPSGWLLSTGSVPRAFIIATLGASLILAQSLALLITLGLVLALGLALQERVRRFETHSPVSGQTFTGGWVVDGGSFSHQTADRKRLTICGVSVLDGGSL